MTDRLGIGLIGAGFVGKFHVRSFLGVRHADITAVCSRTEKSAGEAAGIARLGIRVGRVLAHYGFEVERARGEGITPGTFEIVATLPPGQTHFTDRAASAGATYWYRVRARTSRGATAYTEARRVSSAERASLITELRPSNYRLTPLGVGERYYIDRAYTLASFPSVLDGGLLVRTANDDKRARGERFLSFVITRAATLYVGFDRRAQRLPYWLDEWEVVKKRVVVEGDAMGSFELYRRDFPAGRVTLGANSAAGGDWGDAGTSQYIVIVAPE